MTFFACATPAASTTGPRREAGRTSPELEARDAPSAVDWDERNTEAVALLSQLAGVDSSHPGGRRTEDAARILVAFLSRHGIEAERVLLGPGRAGVFARIAAQSPSQESPLLLASHLDTLPADAVLWRPETPPFGGAVHEGALYGRGVLSGKGGAALHALTMTALKISGAALSRDILLIAVPDGVLGGSEGLDALIRRHPRVATASIALTPSGLGVDDWLGDGRIVHHATNAGLGHLRLAIAVPPRDGVPGSAPAEWADANLRLARALGAMSDRWRAPRVTDTAMRILVETRRDSGLVGRWFAKSRLLARLFAIDALARNPATRGLVLDEVAVTRLSGGLDGGSVVPLRAQATVIVHLHPDESPASMRVRVEHAIGDPAVRVTVIDGEPSFQGPRSVGVEDCLRRWLPNSTTRRQVVAIGYARGPVLDRQLARLGIRTYGALPFVVAPEDLGRMEGRDEHVSIENLRTGLATMFAIVRELAGALPSSIDDAS